MKQVSNSKKSRMFEFINLTWNPFVGCEHNCTYCWARRIAKRSRCYECKHFLPHVHPERFSQRFKPDSFVFVCDMGDLACATIETLNNILDIVRGNNSSLFLFQTKDPGALYCDREYPENAVLGTTIETNIHYPGVSRAPKVWERFIAMLELDAEKTFLSVEPIMRFDPKPFFRWITAMEPSYGVAIGYDNYNHKLPEPPLEQTLKLIRDLENVGIRIWRKTLRKAWFEK